MKGKVCEAMAAGLPLVTTAVGCQGLKAVPGEHCIVADDAPAFAEGVVRLLADPALAERMGRRARRHIAAVCGAESVRGRLVEMLDAIGGKPRSTSRLQRLCWRLGSPLFLGKTMCKKALILLGARRLRRLFKKGVGSTQWPSPS